MTPREGERINAVQLQNAKVVEGCEIPLLPEVRHYAKICRGGVVVASLYGFALDEDEAVEEEGLFIFISGAPLINE